MPGSGPACGRTDSGSCSICFPLLAGARIEYLEALDNVYGGRMAMNRLNTDEEAFGKHRWLLAQGEKRFLHRTEFGNLHSYAPDELGFRPNGAPPSDHPVSWVWGVLLLMMYSVFTLFFAGVGLFASEDWFLKVLAAILVAVMLGCSFRLAAATRREFRAARVRKQRGLPRPGRVGSVALPDVVDGRFRQ